MPRFSKDDWAKLSPLIDEALNLPPDARTAWLKRHKESHPTLAGELEALLNRESALDAEGFLAAGKEPPRPPMSSLIGQQLGAYTIESELGRGGMGSVWLARRTDGRYEGKAAVKFLSLAVAGPTGEARFRQEGSVLARLTHPNISRLIDAGVTGSGQPYLMLEYVDGRQLDFWCDAHRLGVAERLRLFLQVLEAVGHAHANLIVHRDLKPSNILVTGDGTVKLLDFGIARLLDAGAEGAKPLTGTQDAVFTYQYAAPEQITGDPVSTATDVYSLGVLLYELLAGQHPTGQGAESPADLLRATLDTDPSPMSRVVTPRSTLSGEQARALADKRDTSPDRLSRTFSGDLDNILAKALRKDPAHRYPTVTAFADDIQRYLNHEPVTARAVTWGYRAGKFVRRHRGSVGTAALTLILLVGAAIMTTLQAREARIQRDVALNQVQRVFARAVVQDIVVSDDRGADGRQLTFDEKVDRAITRVKTDFRDRPWVVVEVMVDLAGRYGPDALERHQALLADAQRLGRESGSWQQLAAASCQRAVGWAYIPELDSARKDLAEAKAAFARERARTLDLENRALCYKAEAELLSTEEKHDSAIAVAEQGMRITEPREGEEVSTKANRFVMAGTYARMLRAGGRVREANDMFLQILRDMESVGYGTATDFDGVASNLNAALHLVGEHARTDSMLTSIIAHLEAQHGKDAYPNSLRFLYGAVKVRLGLPDSAEPIMLKALADTTVGQGGISWWIGPLMAQLRVDQGRLDEADKYIAQIRVASNVSIVNRETFVARVRYLRGDRAGAMASLEKQLGEWSTDPTVRFTVPIPYGFAGEWRLAAGNPQAADSLALAGLTFATVDSLALTRSSFVGRLELIRARALAAQHKLPEARAAAERAVVAATNGYGPTRPMTLTAIALRDSLAN